MACTLGFIWRQQGAASYKRIATVEGATFRERKRTRVRFMECGRKMVASYLIHYMDRSHGIDMPHIRGVDVGGRGSETYVVLLKDICRPTKYHWHVELKVN